MAKGKNNIGGSEAFEINIRTLKKALLINFDANLTPMIYGQPGVGKSQIIKEIADDLNAMFHDVRLTSMDATDFSGLPSFVTDENGNKKRATYLPFNIFPLEGDEFPINPKTGKPYERHILLFDELTSASKQLQAAAYRAILDREIGNYKLHPKCHLVAAGNRTTDGAIAYELSTALKSRMISYHLRSDLMQWIDDYASKMVAVKDNEVGFEMDTDKDDNVSKVIRARPQIAPEIIAFLYMNKTNPNVFNNFEDANEKNHYSYACPRSWEFLSRCFYQKDFQEVIQNAKQGKFRDTFVDTKMSQEEMSVLLGQKQVLFSIITGSIGREVGMKLISFLNFFADIPSLDEIVKNPLQCELPKDENVKYAMILMLASQIKRSNRDQIVKYVNRLPEEEYKLLAYKMFMKFQPYIRNLEEVSNMMWKIEGN